MHNTGVTHPNPAEAQREGYKDDGCEGALRFLTLQTLLPLRTYVETQRAAQVFIPLPRGQAWDQGQSLAIYYSSQAPLCVRRLLRTSGEDLGLVSPFSGL